MINLIQFWDSNTPDYIQVLLDGVEEKHPELQYRFFDDKAAFQYIDENFGSENSQLYDSCLNPAMKADIFRYFFLYKEGGLYIDADFKALDSLQPLVDREEKGFVFSRKGNITNSVMFVRHPEDPYMERVLKAASRNIRIRRSNNVWSVTGPSVLNHIWENRDENGLLDGYGVVEADEMKHYLFGMLHLEYKKDDSHWTIARDKGIPIFKDVANHN